MASGSGSNFAVLAGAIAKKQLNARIPVLIYNNPDAKVKERANHYNIPSVFLNHWQFKPREELNRAIVKTFQEYGVKWVITGRLDANCHPGFTRCFSRLA
jgi:phosphoribosylglycinamide formyltransferase-1